MNTHDSYPSNLLKEYQTLLEYFPAHRKLRPLLIVVVKEWMNSHTNNNGHISILEIGAGFGETTEMLLEYIPCAMTIIDKDKDSVGFLKKSLQRFVSRIEIVQADCLEKIKEIESDSFDVFTASWTIHNFTQEERKEFFQEIKRILKPNGLFVVFDKVIDGKEKEEEFWQIHISRLSELGTLGFDKLQLDMISHEERDRQLPYLWLEDELQELIKENSFKDFKIHKRFERDIIFSAIK